MWSGSHIEANVTDIVVLTCHLLIYKRW